MKTKSASNSALEHQLVQIEERHFIPAALMMEYRAGNLHHELTRKIRQFLKEDLCLHTDWLRGAVYADIEVSLPISDDELNAWHSYEDNASRLSTKRRIDIDKCVKATLYLRLKEDKSSLISDNVRLLGHSLFLKRFEAYARFYPNKIALRFNDTTYTYQQANERANQIARFIIEKGTKKGDLVGIFLQRSPEWIIATLAIWKAGAAFVPIDPTIPAGSFKFRIQYLENFNTLLNETKLSCLITDSVLQIRVPNHNTLCLDNIPDQISRENPEIPLSPCDLAYVMYTSGSTGKPKGVLIEHRGLVPCLEAHRECVDLTGNTVMAQYSAPGFDAWIAEMLILGLGGTLSIIPDEIRLDPDRLKKYCQDQKISAVIFTPHLLKQLGGPEDFPYWRALFIVGEKFGWDLARYWIRDNLQVVNGYGLTETTICTTLENLNAYVSSPVTFQGHENYIPIGRPILGTKIKLFTPDEKDLNSITPSPIGIPGEMFISGISLTRDYYGEAKEKNEHRFIEIEEERFYRTGDKAICLEDGRYIVIGRYNRVFKFNSKRMDLDGLENILCKHLDIKVGGAACLADENLGEEAKLIVFLQSKNKERRISDNDIQLYLNQEDIRTVGVPFFLIWKEDEFPKTSNGKKDYEKLLFEYRERKKLNFANSSGAIEKSSNSHLDSLIDKIQSIWQSVLSSKSPFKLDANFFESGGSSVSLMFLLQQLRNAFSTIQESINATLLFDYASIQEQSQIIFNLLNPMQPIVLSSSNNKEIHQSGDRFQYTLYCLPSLLGRVDWDYVEMAKLLSIHYTDLQLVGFESRDPSCMPQSIESIATDFVISLLNHHKGFQRPVFLMGWSTGGTLCIEVVKQLQNRGYQAFAYVIDTLAPFVYQQLSSDKLSDELKQLADLIGKKCHLELKIDTLAIKERKSILEKIDFVFEKLQLAARYSSPDIQKVIWTAKVMRLAEQCYSPAGKLPGFCLFKAEEQLLDKIFRANNTLNWPSEGVTSLTIKSSNHFSILKDSQLHNSLVMTLKFHYRTCKISYLRTKLDRIENYIAPNVKILPLRLKPSERDNLPSVSIREALLDFMLDSHKIVLFIQGESGIGKTTITTHLENILNPQLCKRIALDRYTCDELKQKIREIMSDWPLKFPELRVLILDGYDERMGSTDFNYYETNKLSDYENMKVIITCRSEYLKPGYHANFITDNPKLFEEWLIEGLTDSQVRALVDISVSKKKAQRYYDELSKRPELNQMTKNPLLLSFVLQGLKNLPKGSGVLNRFIIYRAFNQSYFERAEKKIKSTVGYPSNKKPYNQQCRELSQAIAATLYGKKMNNVCYKPDAGMDFLSIERVDDSVWRRFFSSDSEIFLKGCPINVKDYVYQFVHKSEMEYFVVDSMLEILNDDRYTAEGILKWFKDKNLTPMVITGNESVLRFWREGFGLYSLLKDKLFSFVLSTRDRDDLSYLGSITATLLNVAYVSFANYDLSGVRIPMAILDGAIMDNVDFSSANLDLVSFQQSWLRQSRFIGTSLSNVNFGEYPSIQLQEYGCVMTFSDDGQLLAVVDGKFHNQIYIWSTITFECQIYFGDNNGQSIISLAFHPNRMILASGEQFGKVALWNISDGKCINVFCPNNTVVQKISFISKGEKLLACYDNCKVYVLDIASGKSHNVTKDYDGYNGRVQCYAVYSDGKKFVTGTVGGDVTLWDIQTQTKLATMNAQTRVDTLAVHPDGNYIALGSNHGSIFIWDLVMQQYMLLSESPNGIYSVAFIPDMQQLVSCSFDSNISDSNVSFWDLSTGILVSKLNNKKNRYQKIIYNLNTHILALAGRSDCISLLKVDKLNSLVTLQENLVRKISFSYSSKNYQLAYGTLENICLFDPLRDSDLFTIKTEDIVYTLAFHPEGKVLAFCKGLDHKITLWDTTTGICVKTLVGHKLGPNALVFSPDGQFLASGSIDSTVRIWKLDDGACILRLKVGHHVSSMLFHPDCNRMVISTKHDKKNIFIISNIRLSNKIESKILKGHSRSVNTLAFNSVKNLLASGSDDQTIHIWDLDNYRTLNVLKGCVGEVLACVFSEDGQLLVSSNSDNSITFWSCETFDKIYTITIFSPGVFLHFIKNDHLLIALHDGDIQQWEAQYGRWILTKSFVNRSPNLCLEGADFCKSLNLSAMNRRLAEQKGATFDDHKKNTPAFFNARQGADVDDELEAAILLSLELNKTSDFSKN